MNRSRKREKMVIEINYPEKRAMNCYVKKIDRKLKIADKKIVIIRLKKFLAPSIIDLQ